MHLTQAMTFLPFARRVDCKFAFCLLVVVGLNLVARTLFESTVAFCDVLSQIAQILAIIVVSPPTGADNC